MDIGIVRCLSEVPAWSERLARPFRGGGWEAIGIVKCLSEVPVWPER